MKRTTLLSLSTTITTTKRKINILKNIKNTLKEKNFRFLLINEENFRFMIISIKNNRNSDNNCYCCLFVEKNYNYHYNQQNNNNSNEKI